MAIKSTGTLSLATDIVGEFKGTAPHKLSEYYAGAGLVPSGTKGVGGHAIPATGTIRFSDFYGATSIVIVTPAAGAFTNNYVLDPSKFPGYSAGGSYRIVIPAGVVIGSASATQVAFTVTGFAPSDTIEIINNGEIIGAGGNGGNTPYGVARVNAPGQAGGTAFSTNHAVKLTNNGLIGGGGGGGGTGGGWAGVLAPHENGGGGAGVVPGKWKTVNQAYTAGADGTKYAGGHGAGPSGGNGRGGDGGALGQPGGNGSPGSAGAGAAGGAGGNAIVGISLVTLVVAGDIRGARV